MEKRGIYDTADESLESKLDIIEDELGLPIGMAHALGALEVAQLCAVWLDRDQQKEQELGRSTGQYPARRIRRYNPAVSSAYHRP